MKHKNKKPHQKLLKQLNVKETPLWVDKFIFDVLKHFYSKDDTHYKVYNPNEILIIRYMINEGLLNVSVLQKNPLLIKGQISDLGTAQLFLQKL